jgi:hypothetical protein
LPIINRLKSAWNVFRQNESPLADDYEMGPSTYTPSSPTRTRRAFTNERTVIQSIYAQISIDVADIIFRHVQFDENDRYVGDIDSPLNDCLTFEPNLDQGPRAFRQDIAMTLCDKGVAAIVPIDTTVDPQTNEIVDIFSLRIGEIVCWYPKHVRVSVYNENTGNREEVTVPKRIVAIVENPLYTVMNEINSTYQRLVRKLSLLDAVDEQSASGKLDLIIQLPYNLRSEAMQKRAETRREQIEMQLKDSKYGIAYSDSTEKITQLNRPVENNLLKQVEYLTDMLYNQLGITKAVMDGSADEKAMLNYHNRTIKPIVDAIKEAMQRSFLGAVKTKKRERIYYYLDAFKLVPMAQLAEITDVLSRNEVLSPNEVRGIIGFKPATDPKADQLINSNMPQADRAQASTQAVDDMDQVMNDVFDSLGSDLDKILASTTPSSNGKVTANGSG